MNLRPTSTHWLFLVAMGMSCLIKPLLAAPGNSSPDTFLKAIEALQPGKLVWREIDWRYCLLKGIEDSRQAKKPILLWAFINADPSEERC